MPNRNQTQDHGNQQGSDRGFAAMDHETLREIARKGGEAVNEDRAHMSDIGRNGVGAFGGSRARAGTNSRPHGGFRSDGSGSNRGSAGSRESDRSSRSAGSRGDDGIQGGRSASPRDDNDRGGNRSRNPDDSGSPGSKGTRGTESRAAASEPPDTTKPAQADVVVCSDVRIQRMPVTRASQARRACTPPTKP